MGVLEKPATDGPAKAESPAPALGYVLARLVPAVLSAVIGWLYVDAFVLKGVDSLVTRARRYCRLEASSPTPSRVCTA